MMKRLAGAALLMAVCATGAAAQTTANGTATLTIGELLYLDVTGLAGLSFSFDPADFGNPTMYADANQSSDVRHRGNVAHTVNLRADATEFGGSGRAGKPSQHLQVNIGGSGVWTGLATTELPVVLSSPAGDFTGSPTAVEYRIEVVAEDTPGTYTLDFTYTIVAG